MDPQQENLDMRTRDDERFVDFEASRYKPGRDYFTETFYSLFSVFAFTLLFWKSLNGVSSEIDLNHFTVGQVTLLFVLLLMLLVERMLYRGRGDGALTKHREAIRLAIYFM